MRASWSNSLRLEQSPVSLFPLEVAPVADPADGQSMTSSLRTSMNSIEVDVLSMWTNQPELLLARLDCEGKNSIKFAVGDPPSINPLLHQHVPSGVVATEICVLTILVRYRNWARISNGLWFVVMMPGSRMLLCSLFYLSVVRFLSCVFPIIILFSIWSRFVADIMHRRSWYMR